MNEELDELLRKIEGQLPRFYGRLTKEADKTRLLIEDTLTKYANNEGLIPRSKQTAATRDIRKIESELYRNIQRELKTIFTEVTDDSMMGVAMAVTGAIDATTLAAALGIASATSLSALGLLTFLLDNAVGSSTNSLDSLYNAPFTRKDVDGLRLNDRLKDIAKQITREVVSQVRQGTNKRETVPSISLRVKKAFKKLDWRLKTIVETEVLYAMRNVIGRTASALEQFGFVKGVKIVDYPHGKPGEHEHHKCYKYARADEYGLGAGIYPTGTRKIRNPHPRCRSTLHFVFTNK